jgi:hypothetical protein
MPPCWPRSAPGFAENSTGDALRLFPPMSGVGCKKHGASAQGASAGCRARPAAGRLHEPAMKFLNERKSASFGGDGGGQGVKTSKSSTNSWLLRLPPRTLRTRHRCGGRNRLGLVRTTQAANNQYSTSSTQHGHHTQMGVPTQESTGKLEGAMTSADALRTSESEALRLQFSYRLKSGVVRGSSVLRNGYVDISYHTVGVTCYRDPPRA